VALGPDTRLRVAVDANPLLNERTGVGHFTASLLEGLAIRDDIEASAYAISRTGRHDLAHQLPAGVGAATSWLPARVAHAMWARVSWPGVEHWTGAVDVVHATNFVAPPSRAPIVVTVHDLAFAHSPELCRPETLSYEPLLRQAIARGALVHAVSDFVAAEVRDYFNLPEHRVVRVYAGIAATGNGDAAAGRELAGGASYILAIGTVEPRKNLPTLVRAFDRVAADDDGVMLVVAGPDGWGTQPFADAVAGARFGARIRRLGYVTNAQRSDLLAGASVLAYPSLYEGFGHPPFEAMAAGVPVVTARAGALPEAVGDAAVLVDPTDVDALADALSRVLTDPVLRAQLVARGHERVQEFSWPRAVDEIVALYRQVSA
jgi:glycosyltransferase involved in cell wall biosynthesis